MSHPAPPMYQTLLATHLLLRATPPLPHARRGNLSPARCSTPAWAHTFLITTFRNLLRGHFHCIFGPFTFSLLATQNTNYCSCLLHLTLMLLVSNLTNMKRCKTPEKPWHMGTHLRVLIKGNPLNTNMTGFRWFSKIFASLWTKVALALEGFTILSQTHPY